ncbi:MAG: carboxy-S-adenosyl-L-methionine synthase CmoA [Pseudomonadales bacterium]|uniref:carboxy-S-adenosyl-L-methionine synthase CmoA n=1 Tax=unclassified Ketobacter TaxID=2639109 RepID=UPI000C930D38|nr:MULTISPECIES: carboxy-S-adenosyl-L-methionine synthase CmoA [unclassified Ketobacter]MAA59032.1 carboxy-S-adenosyl-L-methionine synthase CmoA [Pseudomonadales bacterium]TNC88247.1 MAG: carboxy-S-adenosyl-L-methionine synthase CmoA [Alcanivorax sp.]MAQ23469.1 carboxy-S-adenosyl-L-methionine synthase CmoA [Pseudomonadales bacterium]RLT90486.1 MAG: carboxy-S-adenosyl-L-methionine synthase CmoA [Ketobacter sp. GenoA1]RLT99584.1 MAG: carboxy-S-adenosyl-L-methionine synthase CmoA [Ketobacter sp.]
MSDKPAQDNLFAKPLPHLVDFAFDEQVASVFPDMIRRSVPGYETVIAMLGVFASSLVTPGSRVYDLGCSQGAATLALRRHIREADVTLVAVDNAAPMIERCRSNVAADLSPSRVELRCEDIQDTPIHNASLVALNYTLQFVPLDQRLGLIQRLYSGMNPGAGLILSEKIALPEGEQQPFTHWHHEFKRLNGYSDLEISQKRQAIENVLIPETAAAHRERLLQAGFRQVSCWFQCFNFASFIALK